jgi:hypothetical protein
MPLQLHFMEGLNQKEVSRLMGISETLVHRRIQAGLELLRKRLARSQAVLTVAALSELMRNGVVIKAPHSLRNALAKLAAHSKPLIPVAIELAPTGGRSASVWVAAASVLCIAAMVGTWHFFSADQNAASRAKTVPPNAENQTTANGRADKFHHRWTFENGPAADLQLLTGNSDLLISGKSVFHRLFCKNLEGSELR